MRIGKKETPSQPLPQAIVNIYSPRKSLFATVTNACFDRPLPLPGGTGFDNQNAHKNVLIQFEIVVACENIYTTA